MTNLKTRVLKTSSKPIYLHSPDVQVKFSNFCSSLLETGVFSDFSVICGDHTWKTHKAILCRTEYFKGAIMRGFKEAQENQISILNFQPFEVGILLRHIYYPSMSLIQQATPSFILIIRQQKRTLTLLASEILLSPFSTLVSECGISGTSSKS